MTLRGYAKDDITVTPYADIYASIKYGSYLVQQRANRNVAYTLACPLSNVNDTEIYIYSASQLQSIGDLSGLMVGYADFSMATRLQSLKVGDAADSYTNGNLTELYLGNNTLLRTLDVRNCPNLKQAVDVSGCTNIEHLYFEGTAVTGVQLPNGGILKTLHLPATVTNLTIRNQKAISDFSMVGYDNISTLRLENVSEVFDLWEILHSIPAGARVRITGLERTFEDAADILAFYDLLDTMRGLDENGNNMDKAQIRGTFTVAELTNDELAEMRERYPNIRIQYEHTHSNVYFYDDSGNTLLKTVTVYDGGDAAYTGNLLFQKEYTTDPISKKSRKNRGELPQYWVENTHEAIIPMEVYQAVQEEKARRRELGVFANWSINTSCFTSKIKCGRCGKSYQRSNRKGRKDPNANYAVWICGTRRKTGNAQCQNKDIPEPMLKEACAAVMGLAEFDETIFSEQVDHIEIPAPNEMVFYFKDGRIVPHHWESTMRKDCWTDERRAAKGRYVQDHQLGPNSSCFTSRIRCDQCGENYRRQRSRHKDGSYDAVWRCASSGQCSSPSIKEETLMKLCAEAMGFNEFDETAFREQISCIHITAPFQLSIHFLDGHTIEAVWENKRKMPKHSDERIQHMREVMIQKWRERHGESDNHSGNDQPVYGSAN